MTAPTTDARTLTGCYCPGDCTCRNPHRATLCGCTGTHAPKEWPAAGPANTDQLLPVRGPAWTPTRSTRATPRTVHATRTESVRVDDAVTVLCGRVLAVHVIHNRGDWDGIVAARTWSPCASCAARARQD